MKNYEYMGYSIKQDYKKLYRIYDWDYEYESLASLNLFKSIDEACMYIVNYLIEKD